MKNKISIMNKRQEITDEEIERFKDFDALLVRHRQASSGNSRSWMTWIGAGSVAVIGLLAVYYFSRPEVPVVSNQEPIPSVQEKINPDSVTKYESVGKEEVTEQEEIQPTASSSKETKAKEKPVEEKSPAQHEQKQQDVRPVPVYILAEPVNGYAHLYEYFNRELIYPKEAIKDSIQGVLTVSFVVDKTGNVGKLEFINSLGKPFEEEAARLIKNMPAWKPATLNGDPVPSKMSLPLTFQIQALEKK